MNADDLRSALTASGLAQPGDVRGCTPADVAALRQHYGALPESYCALLRVMGQGAGRLAERSGLAFSYNDLDRINAHAREALELLAQDGHDPEVPEDAFFVCDRYGEDPMFVRANGAADSPVWLLESDLGRTVRIKDSVWGWIAALVADAGTASRASTRR